MNNEQNEMPIEQQRQQRLNVQINAGVAIQKQIDILNESLADLIEVTCKGEKLCKAAEFKAYVKLRIDADNEIKKAKDKLDDLIEKKEVVDSLGRFK